MNKCQKNVKNFWEKTNTLSWIKDLLWPNNMNFYEKPWILRNVEQKKKTRIDTLAKLIL